MKLRLDLIFSFSTIFRLFFNTTVPPPYRDHHIPSCCCHCYYSSLFFLSRSRHAAIHSMAFQLPAGEYIEDVNPRFAEPLRFNTMPPPPRTTRPWATTTPCRNTLSLLPPPVDDGPWLPCRSRGPLWLAGHPQRQGSQDPRLLRQS